MVSQPSPTDPSDYLQSLMQAGQFATKQFEDAVSAAMGVPSAPAKQGTIPSLADVANLQQQYWAPVFDFWRGFFRDKPAPGDSSVRTSRGDRRFKDDAWNQSPYYDMLKQSYLSNSKQLAEFVDQAQIDDRSKLQL